jgi:AraC-like DNA-binding protein/mannose-6-phosphate isomerase-like protein (cupin superfamily)
MYETTKCYPKRLPGDHMIKMQKKFPKIPGERETESPDICTALRMMELRPFVRQSGDEWRNPWHIKERTLLDYLIVLIEKGAGCFKVGGNEFTVGQGDMVWIPPATPHDMEGYPPVMHCLFIHFDLIYNPERSHWDACIPGGVLDMSPWSEIMHPPINDPVIGKWKGKLPFQASPRINSLFKSICIEHRHSAAKSAMLTSAMMTELLHELILLCIPAGECPPLHFNEVQETALHIERNPGEKLDIAGLSARLRMSQSHFRMLFKKVTGTSPRTLHRKACIRRSCELLSYSRLTVSEIAYRLGFSTVHHFSRAFHDVMGLWPRDYRKGGGGG